jgi:predicted nuclease with RNAse H fold
MTPHRRSKSGSRVLGIDLAAQKGKTCACVLVSRGKKLRADLHDHCDDQRLIDLGQGCDKVAIDAPLGWPDAFVEAISAHRDLAPWPQRASEGFTELYFRGTDLVVTQDRRPLSVAADKLGVTAMRCAELLREWPTGRAADRTGFGLFVEVYPAAALIRWGLSPAGYKGNAGREARGKLLARLTKLLPALELSPESKKLAGESDDAFDALIAALAGRAALLGLTDGPPSDRRSAARREGWIHLPLRTSLPYLAESGSPGKLVAAAPLAERLGKSAKLDRNGYAGKIEDALLPTVSPEARRRIEHDFNGKGGSELVREKGRRPKFFAAHSSAALAANVFAPFLDGAGPVPIGGRRFSGEMALERECPTGLRGVPPTLDFMAIGKARVLAVESKCTEPYAGNGQVALFRRAYASVEDHMHPSWREEMRRLRENPVRFRYLNAAQLIKHYLGLKRQFPDKAIVLAYAYWEPSNADALAACAIHQAEIESFSAGVDDPQVEFFPTSYSKLWAGWAKEPKLKKHVAALRRRYEMPAEALR